MHLFEPEAEALAKQVFGYVERRLAGPPALNAPKSEEELGRLAGKTITEEGLGAGEAFRIFEEVLAPACVNISHPRFLSFVPNAPTTASILFDFAVSASAISAEWWIEASGAVHAENETLRWIAGFLGLPAGAGGAFVSGGTAGNLSALAVARDAWRRRGAGDERPSVAITAGGHSSLRLAARILDVEVVEVEADERGRMLGRGARGGTRKGPSRTSSPSRPRRARPTSARSTSWMRSPSAAPSAASGCTSTAPTEAPRRSCPRSGPASRG